MESTWLDSESGDERGDGSGRRRMLLRRRWSHRSCLAAGGTGLAETGVP